MWLWDKFFKKSEKTKDNNFFVTRSGAGMRELPVEAIEANEEHFNNVLERAKKRIERDRSYPGFVDDLTHEYDPNSSHGKAIIATLRNKIKRGQKISILTKKGRYLFELDSDREVKVTRLRKT